MLTNKPLSSFNSDDLKQIIPHLSFFKYESAEISKNSHHLISLLAQLKAKHTYKFVKSIDTLYPGMSFHFVMEAKTHQENEAYKLFLFRISYHMFAFPEKDLFSPMRNRLITGLISSSRKDSLFSELKVSLSQIDNLVSLNKNQKKFLKKNINDCFFEHFSLIDEVETNDPTLD